MLLPDIIVQCPDPMICCERFYYLPFGLLGQAAIGIATLMLVVPLPLAVAHQAGAFILFSLGLFALHGVRRARP